MIKAIETQYKGYRFRSRLEARWAVFFDALGIRWEYEKEGYDLGDAGWYLPDFWLPDYNEWIEVKPDDAAPPQSKIFLAGKMTDWRARLHTHGYWITGPDPAVRIWNKETPKGKEWQESFSTSGIPFCDSGLTSVHEACNYLWDDNQFAIQRSDSVFVWLDTVDACGTIAEAAWAAGIGKNVYLAAPKICTNDCSGHGQGNVTEWWVLEKLATKTRECDDPQEAFDLWFPPSTQEHDMKSAALSTLGHTVFNVCGTFGHDGRIVWVEFKDGRLSNRSGAPAFLNDRRVLDICNRTVSTDKYPWALARAARFEHGETP